jgi:hypothetical protein
LLANLALLAVACLIVEGTARLALSVDALRLRLSGQDDASWRLDWVARHRGSTGIYYTFDVFDPTKGWISRPLLRDHPAFAGKTVSTNSLGLRGTREYGAEPPVGRTRVLLLGDSFTFGDELSDGETFAERLRQLRPDLEVMNFGVHGYGHDQMLILLREGGLRLRPAVVLLFFVSEDAVRNTLSFRDFAKPRFVLADGAIELSAAPLPTPEEVLAGEWRRPRVADLAVMLRRGVRDLSGANGREVTALTSALLSAIAGEARASGAAFTLVDLPAPDELASGRPLSPAGKAAYDAFCAADGACASLAGPLAGVLGDRMPNGHWGPKGQRRIADAVSALLPPARP